MREIKFRGKITDNGEWAYGFGVFPIEDENGEIEKCDLYTTSGIIEVDPETVGQYTGLKDRNGKDIYEGDFFTDTVDNYLWQIFFSDGCYYAESGSYTFMLQEFMDKSGSCDIEVIGNIFEDGGLVDDSKKSKDD